MINYSYQFYDDHYEMEMGRLRICCTGEGDLYGSFSICPDHLYAIMPLHKHHLSKVTSNIVTIDRTPRGAYVARAKTRKYYQVEFFSNNDRNMESQIEKFIEGYTLIE